MKNNPNITQQFLARLHDAGESGTFLGWPLKLRRFRAKVMYEQGKMPMFFADAYRQALGAEAQDAINVDPARKLNAEEHQEFVKFQLDIVVDSCLEPKLKRQADDPGDVLLSDVPDEDLEFIYLYALRMANFPASQEEQKEEVTAATLKPFLRDRSRTPKSDRAGKHGATVRPTTQRGAPARAK